MKAKRKRYVIPPKIAALKVSRQRKLQLVYKSLGLCVLCGQKAVTAMHCVKHAKDDNRRKYKKKTKRIYRSIVWRHEQARRGEG